MMFSTVFGAILAVGCLMGAARSYDDCSVELDYEVAVCGRRYGAHPYIDMMDPKHYLDPEIIRYPAFCDHVDYYKNATICAYPVVQTCLDQKQEEGALPDLNKMLQGLDYLCGRRSEMDTMCAQGQGNSFDKCLDETFKNVTKELHVNSTTSQGICLYEDVRYDCLGKSLENCSRSTREIFLEFRNNYYVPAACVANPPGRPGRQPFNYSQSY